MENFDDFFKEKLNSEQPFGGRAESWAKLDKQLGAFDAGQLTQPPTGLRALRFWQVAAAASVVGMIWLGWENVRLQRLNSGLKTEILAQKTPEDLEQKTIQVAPTQSVLGENQPTNLDQKEVEHLPKNQPGAAENLTGKKVFGEKKNGQQMPAFSEKTTENEDRLFQKNKNLSFQKNQKNQPIVFEKNNETMNDFDKKAFQENNNGASNFAANAEIARLTALADSLRAIVLLENQLDSVAVFDKIEPKNAPPVATQTERKTTVESPTAPLVRPVHRPTRFRIGVQAVASQDLKNMDKKSWAKGQGLSAEIALKKGLSVAATADWSTYSFESEKTPHHIRPVDTTGFNDHHGGGNNGPGGGHKPNYELKKVEGTQRQQNFSVGLNYALPVDFVVRPVFRVGHNWTHRSQIVTSSRFEDKPDQGGPGGPNPDKPVVIAEKTPAAWDKNIWRFGLGLDYQRARWTAGLSADLNRDFGKKNTEPDALTLRAGIAYAF